jgi:hypothetical protein
MAFESIPEDEEHGLPRVCGGNIKKRNGKLECDSLDCDSCDCRMNCDDFNFISELVSASSKIPNEKLKMSGQWDWLIGRKLSLGEVIYVSDDAAIVQRGDDEIHILLCDLLKDDYEEHDRFDRDLNEAWNTGDGIYRP